MIHHFVLVVAYWSSNSRLYHGPQNPFSTQKLGYLRNNMEWCKFAASKLETTQATWIAAELLTLAKESGCGSLLGAMVLGMGGPRSMESQWPKQSKYHTEVKSLQFLHPPFPPFIPQSWDMKHGKHDPFVKDSFRPLYHLRSWKVCFVIRGISHVSSPYWAVDINLTWSWNLDLVKIHGFFSRSPLRLEGVATSKDWYDLVSSFLNFVYVHRAVRMNTGRLHGIFLCYKLDQVATWCFMFTPSWR